MCEDRCAWPPLDSVSLIKNNQIMGPLQRLPEPAGDDQRARRPGLRIQFDKEAVPNFRDEHPKHVIHEQNVRIVL